jgi:hypothetical protein
MNSRTLTVKEIDILKVIFKIKNMFQNAEEEKYYLLFWLEQLTKAIEKIEMDDKISPREMNLETNDPKYLLSYFFFLFNIEKNLFKQGLFF